MDQVKLIDIYEHLFAEQGWKELVADLGEKREAIKNLLADSSTNFDQVQFYRGLLAGYRYIIGLEGMVETAKSQALPDAS